MIAQSFDYSSPSDLKEALGLIAAGAKPLAGGMSLIPMMKLRFATPEHLVDLRQIAGLNAIQEKGGRVEIGAMATHYEIESSPLIRAKCPLLAETAGAIGDLQVRNMGTIGGSAAHADPAADYPAALLALEADLVLSQASGQRTVSAAEFFLDTFTTALEPNEIITQIVVPTDDKSTGVAYVKMSHPASGFAVVGVAARLQVANAKIVRARVGVTGVASHAFRAVEAENALEAGGDVKTALLTIGNGVDGNSDIHASAEYRIAMARVYAARAVQKALSRAS
jgi:carbon-monoxide dehydrogenase medium subunit